MGTRNFKGGNARTPFTMHAHSLNVNAMMFRRDGSIQERQSIYYGYKRTPILYPFLLHYVMPISHGYSTMVSMVISLVQKDVTLIPCMFRMLPSHTSYNFIPTSFYILQSWQL